MDESYIRDLPGLEDSIARSYVSSVSISPSPLPSPSPSPSPSQSQSPPHTTNNATPPNLSTLEKSQTALSGTESAIPFWRRCLILFVLSWCCLASTFSSTSLLSVSVEIAKDLNSSTEAVNLSTAGLVLISGFGSFVWSPITDVSFLLACFPDGGRKGCVFFGSETDCRVDFWKTIGLFALYCLSFFVHYGGRFGEGYAYVYSYAYSFGVFRGDFLSSQWTDYFGRVLSTCEYYQLPYDV